MRCRIFLYWHIFSFRSTIKSKTTIKTAGRGGTVVKVLCYKSEGRCFDPSWCHPSDRTMALGSTQLLREMSTRRISWG